MKNKIDGLSKSKFAELAGVTKQAINGAIGRDVIPVMSNGKIDPSDYRCVSYIKNQQLKRQKKNISIMSTGGRPTDEEYFSKLSQYTKNLEVRKLKAQTINLETKNKLVRGELCNVKFIESLFFTQLNYTIQQFLTLPDSMVDDLISLAIEKGTGARVDIVNRMTRRINQINTGAKKGWIKNIERVKSDFLNSEDKDDNDY